MIVLPKEKIKAKVQNPRFLILFGKPKAGKTTLVSKLENNLIVDLEGGSEFLDALAVQARSVKDLGDIANAIKEEINTSGNKPYKYITIDNASRLEEMALPYAVQLYKATPMGKSYQGTDVRTLPNGSGYLYLQQAVRKIQLPSSIIKPVSSARGINWAGDTIPSFGCFQRINASKPGL
mgnify:CR=1 FL=1